MSKLVSLTCLTLIAVLVSVGVGATPATAAKAKPSVSVATASTATACTKATLRGKLSRGGAGLKVTLQAKSGSRWKTVQQKRQGNRKSFTFAVKVAAGSQSYRVLTTQTRTLARSTSRVVRINGVTPATRPAATGTTELDRARATILASTNAYRAKKCLRPLALHAGLSAIAQGWAGTMAVQNKMVHNTGLSSVVPGAWRRIGENIGMGYGLSAITPAWYASPGHKANILGDFTHLGIGFVRDSEGTPWYVQDFAKY